MEGTLIEWITDHLIAFLTPVVMLATPIATLWWKRYLDRKDKTPHSVSLAVEKNKRLQELCRTIQVKLGAQRVNVWLFHNGGYFYTGEPIQKLSMICEQNADGVEPVIHKFQAQPLSVYQRNLEKLMENDYFYEYNELQYKDSLAILNQLYAITSSALFKLYNKEKYFSGILAIGYDHHHNIMSSEVEAVKEISKQIEIELGSHKLY